MVVSVIYDKQFTIRVRLMMVASQRDRKQVGAVTGSKNSADERQTGIRQTRHPYAEAPAHRGPAPAQKLKNQLDVIMGGVHSNSPHTFGYAMSELFAGET